MANRFSEKLREAARQQFVSDELWAEGCAALQQQVIKHVIVITHHISANNVLTLTCMKPTARCSHM
jgi:hypothetical protein